MQGTTSNTYYNHNTYKVVSSLEVSYIFKVGEHILNTTDIYDFKTRTKDHKCMIDGIDYGFDKACYELAKLFRENDVNEMELIDIEHKYK